MTTTTWDDATIEVCCAARAINDRLTDLQIEQRIMEATERCEGVHGQVQRECSAERWLKEAARLRDEWMRVITAVDLLTPMVQVMAKPR